MDETLTIETGLRSLEVSQYKGEVYLEIDAPWSGSTDSGFGRNEGISLSAEQALQVANWIIAALSRAAGE